MTTVGLLPATVRVAFLLGTDPALFRATHQYTPPSCSFLPCITRRKKRDPVGSRTRCDLASPGDVCTSSPSLYHSITGSGLPSALQFNVTGSFFATIMSDGCSVIRGLFSCPEKQERKVPLQQISFLSSPLLFSPRASCRLGNLISSPLQPEIFSPRHCVLLLC